MLKIVLLKKEYDKGYTLQSPTAMCKILLYNKYTQSEAICLLKIHIHQSPNTSNSQRLFFLNLCIFLQFPKVINYHQQMLGAYVKLIHINL